MIEDKNFLNTDTILAEKWLNNTLTKDDITLAQKEGRLNNSNTVSSWLGRLGTKFDTGVYDNAMAITRTVRFDKGQYTNARKWLLENAGALGAKYSEVRNRLETNMNADSTKTGPHIARAHRLIDDFAKDNPTINDGTLGSIERIQKLHDAVNIRSNQTPEQIRDLTQGLLLPFEEEQAKSWFGSLIGATTKFGPVPMILRASKRKRALKQRTFRGVMLIQPVTKTEFKSKVTGLKSIFGEDSQEAKSFYEKYSNSAVCYVGSFSNCHGSGSSRR